MSDRKGALDTASDSGSNDIDSALLARIKQGDRRALEELYKRYHQPLLRFIYRLTGDLFDAEEGVNDVMLVVWRTSARFEGRSRISTWIMGIAYHKALKIKNLSSRWTNRFKAREWTESIEPSGDSGELTDDRAERELLYRAVDALPVKQRAVVELTYFYDYSYEEIAAIVGCPVNTVKTRMFHARAKLKRALPMLSPDDIES